MELSKKEIRMYQENGYLLLQNVFDQNELDVMHKEKEMLVADKEYDPRKILEKNGVVRSFYAPDFTSELFKKIVRSKRMVNPSKQLLNDEVYAHQTKLNNKEALHGDTWPWHQDYVFWKNDDLMPDCKVLTAMIFMDDVTEFNSPLFVVPGSHKIGVFENEFQTNDLSNESGEFLKYQNSKPYMSALTANLKYTLKQEIVNNIIREKGIKSMVGKAGSVLFFHGNLFHASTNNLSPWSRNSFLITYNSINNKLKTMSNPRPDFIANRNFEVITPIDEEKIVQLSKNTMIT